MICQFWDRRGTWAGSSGPPGWCRSQGSSISHWRIARPCVSRQKIWWSHASKWDLSDCRLGRRFLSRRLGLSSNISCQLHYTLWPCVFCRCRRDLWAHSEHHYLGPAFGDRPRSFFSPLLLLRAQSSLAGALLHFGCRSRCNSLQSACSGFENRLWRSHLFCSFCLRPDPEHWLSVRCRSLTRDPPSFWFRGSVQFAFLPPKLRCLRSENWSQWAK